MNLKFTIWVLKIKDSKKRQKFYENKNRMNYFFFGYEDENGRLSPYRDRLSRKVETDDARNTRARLQNCRRSEDSSGEPICVWREEY